MKCNNELKHILKFGILKEHQSEIITDGLRALIMEAYGYKSKVIEFISKEHTGKNLMITGIRKKEYNGGEKKIIQKITDIKKQFGIQYHHLEKLLNEKP
jgi:hypothetical protein